MIYETSADFMVKGNHLGFIPLEAPGQYSIATKGQLALLQKLFAEESPEHHFRSFDDSEAAHREARQNVHFKLIFLGSNAIMPGGKTILAGDQSAQIQ